MERRLREILARDGAREGFAKALRARFVSGQFEAEKVLRDAPGDGADPEFRTELKSAFVGGELGAAPADELPGGLREGLGASLGGDAAAGGYRARLKAQFILGELEDGASEAPVTASAAVPAAGVPETDPDDEALAPIHDLSSARKARGRAPLVALAIAAIALFAFVLPTTLGPDWLVQRAPNEATAVLFDRAPLDPSIQSLDVETGRVLACGSEALRLALDERALVEAAPQSQVRFCAPIQRLFADALAPVHLDKGELNVRTLPGAALTMTIDTPNALIRLQEAAVSVLATDRGTCICVLEGEVLVSPAQGGEARVIGANERIFVPLGTGDCQVAGDIDSDPVITGSDRLERLKRMLVDIDAGVF